MSRFNRSSKISSIEKIRDILVFKPKQVGLFMIIFLFFLSLILGPLPVYGAEAASFDIQIPSDSYKFIPDKLTIKAGDTIRWHNNSDRKHVLSSVPGSGVSDELEIFSDEFHPGTIYSHTFKEPGEYPYFCFIHNKMTGIITVRGKDQ
jgi:plastocyanin